MIEQGRPRSYQNAILRALRERVADESRRGGQMAENVRAERVVQRDVERAQRTLRRDGRLAFHDRDDVGDSEIGYLGHVRGRCKAG